MEKGSERLDAKRFLERVKWCDAVVENKVRELGELRDTTLRITACVGGDRVQSSGGKDKLADAIARIVDLENKLDADIDRLVDARNEAIEVIDKVADARLIDLLHRRYVSGQTWEQIAFEMGYTYQWVCELNKVAVDEIQKLLDT